MCATFVRQICASFNAALTAAATTENCTSFEWRMRQRFAVFAEAGLLEVDVRLSASACVSMQLRISSKRLPEKTYTM